MIGFQTQIVDQVQRVTNAAQKATFRNMGHAAARISKDVKESLVTAEGPSAPGEPPHTHQGTYLRRAVRYAADMDSAVIGPAASVVGEVGAAHEFGEDFHGQAFDERPFMEPGLDKNLDRFAKDWEGSISE